MRMKIKNDKEFKIEQPLDYREPETKRWESIPRVSSTIPFGYVLDEENPRILRPVELELEALIVAKEHMKRYALREVANWISQVTGRRISHVGLQKRLDNGKKRNDKAKTIRKWAATAQKALETAEQIEKENYGL
jgi:hypothetical protein|tara:strand:+ start:597 stop:1001 length:405 start_codon:yes stop_codon:yes gene_type:complete